MGKQENISYIQFKHNCPEKWSEEPGRPDKCQNVSPIPIDDDFYALPTAQTPFGFATASTCLPAPTP